MEKRVEDALMQLAEMQALLEKSGGPEKNGELFSEIIDVEERLLAQFGLPCTPEFSELISFGSLPDGKTVKATVSLLHMAAQKYLMSDALSEISFLKRALQMKASAFEVLPELKIDTHIYTCFLFDEILLKEKETPENLLKAMRVCMSGDYLDRLGSLVLNPFVNAEEEIRSLSSLGIPFVNEFYLSSKKEN